MKKLTINEKRKILDEMVKNGVSGKSNKYAKEMIKTRQLVKRKYMTFGLK